MKTLIAAGLPVLLIALLAFTAAAHPNPALAKPTPSTPPHDPIHRSAKTGQHTAPTHTQSDSSSAPIIIANGVRMYQVNPSDAGGWPIRAPQDDTYGRGELIAVSVEFDQPVRVNQTATFRIRIGSSNRSLVPVSQRDHAVIFATLIQPSDRDRDGVWIGNHTATLGHNPARYFQSDPETGEPVNANVAHDLLGTQPDHKVNGSAVRPRLQDITITSTPLFDDTYIRGETITLDARFDQPVNANGKVQLRIATEAFQQDVFRLADYSAGNGTSTLTFSYTVGFLDIDLDGIAIPANALASFGQTAQGVHGGGSITANSGGLQPHLNSAAQGENPHHKTDSRLSPLPEIITAVEWDWTAPDSPDTSSIQIDFSINEDPGSLADDRALVLILGWGHIQGTRFAFGLRTDQRRPGADSSQGKGAVFNRWGTSNTSAYGRPATRGWIVPASFNGPFISARQSYHWTTGNYSVRIAQDGPDDDANSSGGAGRWYGFWITKQASGVETHLGSLKFPIIDEAGPKIQTSSDVFSSAVAVIGRDLTNPADIPRFQAAIALPTASEGGAPDAVTVKYATFHGIIANADASFDAATGKTVLTVGGDTRRSTPPNTTITNLTTPQLTAAYSHIPNSHTGYSDAVFRVTFSENTTLSYRTLRDHAFNVIGGSVTKASRVYHSSNQHWEIRVRPSSRGAIAINLPATVNCWDRNAVCTADGRKLTASDQITIPGPDDRN